MSAEGIETAAPSAQTRSEALTGTGGTVQTRSDALAPASPGAPLVAALARAAAVAADAGDLERARLLLADALRMLGVPAALRVVRDGSR